MAHINTVPRAVSFLGLQARAREHGVELPFGNAAPSEPGLLMGKGFADVIIDADDITFGEATFAASGESESRRDGFVRSCAISHALCRQGFTKELLAAAKAAPTAARFARVLGLDAPAPTATALAARVPEAPTAPTAPAAKAPTATGFAPYADFMAAVQAAKAAITKAEAAAEAVRTAFPALAGAAEVEVNAVRAEQARIVREAREAFVFAAMEAADEAVAEVIVDEPEAVEAEA